MQSARSSSTRGASPAPSPRNAPSEVHVQERLELEGDGHRLVATLYTPVGEPRGAVQFHAGIGVRRQFYRRFAAYLAAHGYVVLTFDVRGLGESRFGELRGYRASLSDWGQKDLPAALDWLSERYPNLPKFVVAHSLGGQLVGMMRNCDQLSGLVLIFTCKGDFHSCSRSFKRRLQALLFMGAYLPLTTSLFGYAPVRFLVPAAQDLPAGVAREWTRWFFDREWIAGDCAARGAQTFFRKLTAPVLAFGLDTDWWAPAANCEQLMREYACAEESEFVTLRADDPAAPEGLDHLRYFKREFADSHWSQVLAWLDRRRAQLEAASKPDEPEVMSA